MQKIPEGPIPSMYLQCGFHAYRSTKWPNLFKREWQDNTWISTELIIQASTNRNILLQFFNSQEVNILSPVTTISISVVYQIPTIEPSRNSISNWEMHHVYFVAFASFTGARISSFLTTTHLKTHKCFHIIEKTMKMKTNLQILTAKAQQPVEPLTLW